MANKALGGKPLTTISASFDVFDQALSSGRLASTGKVSDRLVRSAFSALGRAVPGLRMEHVPNPFPAPYNLAWYFGMWVGPGDIRQFVTAIGRRYIRVWSVALDEDGWRILVQVFGSASAADACSQVEFEMRAPAMRLRGWAPEVHPYTFSLENLDAWLHEHQRGFNKNYGVGQFVEITLRRGGVM